MTNDNAIIKAALDVGTELQKLMGSAGVAALKAEVERLLAERDELRKQRDELFCAAAYVKVEIAGGARLDRIREIVGLLSDAMDKIPGETKV